VVIASQSPWDPDRRRAGQQLALASGAPFPPVVFLDGEPFCCGRLSERMLRKALGW
jgi:hypothetical protein